MVHIINFIFIIGFIVVLFFVAAASAYIVNLVHKFKRHNNDRCINRYINRGR